MWIRRIFFFEINVSKWNPRVIIAENFLLQKDKKMILFLWKYRLLDFLIFKHRKKSLCRGVDQKNFLQWNKSFIIKTTCGYIAKIPFAEGWENYSLLRKYQLLKNIAFYTQDKSFWGSVNQKSFLQLINLSKWKLHVITSEKFLQQKDMKMILSAEI